jgi:hypothetical protein
MFLVVIGPDAVRRWVRVSERQLWAPVVIGPAAVRVARSWHRRGMALRPHGHMILAETDRKGKRPARRRGVMRWGGRLLQLFVAISGHDVSFGSWLRRWRKALDLAQAELAARAGYVLITIKTYR